jgi:hypothetical protein
MLAIDVGNGAVTLSNYTANMNVTWIDAANPANASGIITVMEVFFRGDAETGATIRFDGKCCAFSKNGSVFTPRAVVNTISHYETHNIPDGGKKVVFSGLNFDIQAGDYIGIWLNYTGHMRIQDTGGSGYWNYSGDGTTQARTYDNVSGGKIPLYGTGTTIERTYSIVFGV